MTAELRKTIKIFSLVYAHATANDESSEPIVSGDRFLRDVRKRTATECREERYSLLIKGNESHVGENRQALPPRISLPLDEITNV